MTTAQATALLLTTSDNVLCLLRNHRAGERPVYTGGEGPPLTADTPLGHKIARAPIGKGEAVIKYGAAIGRATEDIAAGDHVHLQNLQGFLASEDGQ